LRDYATGVLGWSIEEFWSSTPGEFEGAVEARADDEKRQRIDLAATAFAISINSGREKVSLRDIYGIVVREPMEGGADEEVQEAIYQESKADAINEREKEIRRLIDKVMACPK
jgi:hypothetical protein